MSRLFIKAPNPLPSVLVWLLLRLPAPSGVAAADTPPPRDIIIVYKTHFDIGYTQLARDVADASTARARAGARAPCPCLAGHTRRQPRGAGSASAPLDSPLVSPGEPGSHKFDARYEPTTARVFLNLFNNHWQTNFRNWTGGRITSRVRLWTFDQFESESALLTPAMGARAVARRPTQAAMKAATTTAEGVPVPTFLNSGTDPLADPRMPIDYRLRCFS